MSPEFPQAEAEKSHIWSPVPLTHHNLDPSSPVPATQLSAILLCTVTVMAVSMVHGVSAPVDAPNCLPPRPRSLDPSHGESWSPQVASSCQPSAFTPAHSCGPSDSSGRRQVELPSSHPSCTN